MEKLIVCDVVDFGGAAMNNSSNGPSHSETRSRERKDFDDGANALWTLYGKEAQIHDEARFQSLADDMNGVPTFVCLYHPLYNRLLILVYFRRQACLLVFSLRSSSKAFKVCKIILHKNQHIINNSRSLCWSRSRNKLHPPSNKLPSLLLYRLIRQPPHHLLSFESTFVG
jgi:hypothetical protein